MNRNKMIINEWMGMWQHSKKQCSDFFCRKVKWPLNLKRLRNTSLRWTVESTKTFSQ